MAGGVLLAPAAPLQDLGALVLGDHALDLPEQVLFGAAARRIAQEDDLDAAMGEFLQYQDLIGISARESVRVEDVEAIDGAGGDLVAKSLEARADQGVTAEAVVQEAQLGLAFQGVTRDAPPDRLELAGDRCLLGLLIAGDPGIDRRTEIVMGHG